MSQRKIDMKQQALLGHRKYCFQWLVKLDTRTSLSYCYHNISLADSKHLSNILQQCGISSILGIHKVVDIDPWGSMGLSKGSINTWGSKRGRPGIYSKREEIQNNSFTGLGMQFPLLMYMETAYLISYH